MKAPWTRDGHVRADIVQIAPDVSGFVTDVLVHDNQAVKRGDVIFRIDRERFALALQQADAVVAGRLATLDEANADLKRYHALTTDAVSQQRQEQVLATQQQAKAAYDQALADQAVARLNLDRSEVRAPVNGTITNMDLRPGAYVSAGKGVMALVDTDTLHVEGYFEETKLARIRIGAPARIRLMGTSQELTGHVESIAAGIEDRDRGRGREPARQRQSDLQLGAAGAARAGAHRARRRLTAGRAGGRSLGDGRGPELTSDHQPD